MSRLALSRNFFLDEFTRSQTAVRHDIDMRVDPEGPVFANLQRLCVRVLQPLRDALGPVHVTSGYRPLPLNRRIGSQDGSAHVSGRAADIVVMGYTPLEVARWIERHLRDYDQLIHEFGQWVHVAIAWPDQPAREQLLTAVKIERGLGPSTVYVPGILSVEAAQREAA